MRSLPGICVFKMRMMQWDCACAVNTSFSTLFVVGKRNTKPFCGPSFRFALIHFSDQIRRVQSEWNLRCRLFLLCVSYLGDLGNEHRITMRFLLSFAPPSRNTKFHSDSAKSANRETPVDFAKKGEALLWIWISFQTNGKYLSLIPVFETNVFLNGSETNRGKKKK